jgi:hypothetical protein
MLAPARDPELPDESDMDADWVPPEDGGGWGDEGDGGNGDDGGQWVTVATFSSSPQAHLARLKLESEGIDCFLVDENIVAMDWLLAGAVRGIKLQVPAGRAEEARKLLGEKAAEPTDPSADWTHQCPECGSGDTYQPRFSRKWFFLSLLLLGLPLPGLARTRVCARCGHEWKPQRRGMPLD